MKASIIIRAYNEERRLEECLLAVFAQQTSFPFEVIIVHTESMDGTLSIAKRFPTKIVHIKKEDFTPGKGSNIGCMNASGDYFVFLSGHSIPSSAYWLETLVRNFESPNIAGVYGKQIPFPGCYPWEVRLLTEEWPMKRQSQIDNPFFSLVNAAIRKERWNEVNFNEGGTITDDQEWARDMQRCGYGILYDPEVAVYHSHNTGMMGACERFSKEIHGLYLVHGEHIFLRLFSDIRRAAIRDILFIRAHRYSARWIGRSLLRNTLLFVVLLYMTVSTPYGRQWLMFTLDRFANPLRFVYRLSAFLRRRSETYGLFVDRIKRAYQEPSSLT